MGKYLFRIILTAKILAKDLSYATKKLKQSVPTIPCKGTKIFGPFTHEQLAAIDNKRIRRAPAVILPPSSNILRVKLGERFAHLLNI